MARVSINNGLYRSLIFFFVYMVEMIVTTITLSYFPALFSMMGIDLRLYGFVGGLSLFPLVFKFVVGPISDNFPIPFIRGKRRGYIILGALLNAILLPFLSLNPLTFFALFFIIWFFQTLGIAIMDVMVDTLAIESEALKTPRGRTEASVIMFFGTFVGGWTVSQFIPLIMSDLRLSLIIFALIALIPLVLILFLKERQDNDTPPKSRSYLEDLKTGISYPFVIYGLLFAFILNIDGGLLELTLEPYLITTLGVPIQVVVADLVYISIAGYALGIAGYFLIDKIRKTRLLIIIAFIYLIPLGLLGYLTLTSTLTYTVFLWLYGVFSLVSGLSYVTYMGLFFDLSDPKVAGTMIALFLTLNNLGRLVGIMIGGFFTISTIYFIAFALTALRIIPLWKIRRVDIEKEFYSESPKRGFSKRDLLFALIPGIVITLMILLRFL